MKILVTWIGHNRAQAMDDFIAMRQMGVTAVNFPVSEESMKFQGARYKELTKIARECVIEQVYMSPWGMAGIFGGEGLTEYKYDCQKSCAVTQLMEEFTTLAYKSGVDGIIWDEPRTKCCPIETFLHDNILMADAYHLKNHVYYNDKLWLPHHLHVHKMNQTGKIDCLWKDFYDLEEWEVDHWIRVLNQQKKDKPQQKRGVWIKGFRVRKGDTRVLYALDKALHSSVDYVGIWSWGAGGQMSALESEEGVWYDIKEVLRRGR